MTRFSSFRQNLPYYLLLLILLLGAQIRFTAIDEIDVIAPVRADAKDYLLYAHNIKTHGVYSRSGGFLEDGEAPPPDAVRSPGYPLLIAPIIDTPPNTADLEQIEVLQVFLGIGTIALTFVIGLSLMPASWALIPAFLVAISPHLVSHTVYILTETLFTFAFTAVIALLVHSARSRRQIVLGLTAGALLGVAALIRPTVMYLGLAFLMTSMLPVRFFSTKYCTALLVASLLVMSPWFIRNHLSTGNVTDSHLTINTLHHGMYPDFMYQGDPATYGFPYNADPESEEISKSVGSTLSEILRRFQDEPYRHLKWFLIGKPVTFWSWDIINGAGDIYTYPVRETLYRDWSIPNFTKGFMAAVHWPIVAMGLAFVVAIWVPAVGRVLDHRIVFGGRTLSVIVLYFMAIHMMGAPFPRYSIPLRPTIFISALGGLAASLVMLRLRVRAQRRWTWLDGIQRTFRGDGQ